MAATALREGAVNAGIEAATQPTVKRFNNEVGIDYTWGEAAGNVAMAGAGGAILGGGLHAAGLGLKSLLGRWDEAKAAGHVVADAESDAAEKVLRDADTISSANPMPGVEGQAISFALADDVLRAMREGRPIPADVEIRFRRHRSDALTDLADRAADKATPNGEMVAYGIIAPQQLEEVSARVLALMPEGSTLDNAVRRMDAAGLRHAYDRHGADPIPFRPADAAHVPDVVERGELVEIGRNHQRNNLPYVERRLLVNGNWLHVGETVVGTKRPTLTFQTAFWNKGPENGGAGGPKGGNRPAAPVSPAKMPDASGPTVAHVRNVGDSPASLNMRAVPAERKSLPPELKPPSVRQPETLVGWLKRQGGVNDADGWLAQALSHQPQHRRSDPARACGRAWPEMGGGRVVAGQQRQRSGRRHRCGAAGGS